MRHTPVAWSTHNSRIRAWEEFHSRLEGAQRVHFSDACDMHARGTGCGVRARTRLRPCEAGKLQAHAYCFHSAARGSERKSSQRWERTASSVKWSECGSSLYVGYARNVIADALRALSSAAFRRASVGFGSREWTCKLK
eukprot:3609999-Pleurochrysis_carterae.AAC.4